MAADAGAGAADASEAAPPVDAAVPALANMNTARSLFAAVSGRDGKVRTFAGLSGNGLDDSAEAYDPSKNAWTVAAGKSSVRRYGHAATEDATGHVFVIGGTSDGHDPIGAVEVFAPADGTWTSIADLPTPRLGLAAATGKDGRIYAIGGRDEAGAPTDVVEIYTPSTKTWSTGPKLGTKRLSLVAVAGADGKIYAIGGRDAENAPLAVVEALDVDAATWTSAPPLLTARYWFGATLGSDGHIYAVGGLDDIGFLDSIEVFTPATGWKQLPRMPEPRGWVSAASSADGRVFAIGGSMPQDDGLPGTQPPPMRTMLAFDTKTSTWKK